MPSLSVIDIYDELHIDVRIDFLYQELLDQVKVLQVYPDGHAIDDEEVFDDYQYYEDYRLFGIFFRDLTGFLNRSTQRIDTIEIYETPEGFEENEEYLEFLSLSFTIADCIRGIECFGCYNDDGEGPRECFVAGISQTNGPKKLELYFRRTSPGEDTFEMLSRGIGASVSLEHLEIFDLWFRDAYGAAHVADGLRSNKSLKSFYITLAGRDNNICPVLQALLEHSTLQTLKIKFAGGGNRHDPNPQTIWDIFRAACRRDCALKEIWLENFAFPDEGAASQVDLATLTNTSVESLALIYTHQSLPTLMKVVQLFEALVHLDIRGGNYSSGDLSPLDWLLLSKTASLESLCLSDCLIGVEPMMQFVRKLEGMKTLKVLIADSNPFTKSEVCVANLKDVLWKNTSLEFVLLGGVLPTPIAEKLNLRDKDASLGTVAELSTSEMIPLHLNRAGRGPLMVNSDGPEKSLLPRILERAGKLRYYTTGHEDANDVMFWLLRLVVITQLSA